MESLNFRLDNTDNWKLTFHLPLHRYLSVFAYNAIYKFNIDPALFLPTDNQNTLLKLMFYPLRTIVRRKLHPLDRKEKRFTFLSNNRRDISRAFETDHKGNQTAYEL
jgi:hypothetical protein